MKPLFNNFTAMLIFFVSAWSIETVGAVEGDNRSTDYAKPAITVTAEKPQFIRLVKTLSANGDVSAWQEAIIGNESDGLRLTHVNVNVGDEVKQGQVLATFAAEIVSADLTQIIASVDEAKAAYAEAFKNAQRARDSKVKSAWSEQQIFRYLTEEKATKARLALQRAAAKKQQIKLNNTQVLSPDGGVISSRSATVGAVVPVGHELFRLIRQNRLEWRAEVAAAELVFLKPNDSASITTPSGSIVSGKIRMIAPTVDKQTRTGLVYVDLPSNTALKAGMFAKGKFGLENSDALTLSQQAVVIRDGFNYVFKLGEDFHVVQLKVEIGRIEANRVEVLSGITPDSLIINSGAGFLNDGDKVKLVPVSNSEQSGIR